MAHAYRHLSIASLRRWIFSVGRSGSAGIVALILLGSGLHAQIASPPPEVSVRFAVFSAKRIEGIAFFPRANASPQSLRFYPTARSPRYDYRGTMPLRFVDPADGSVVAEAVIPPGVRDALLLFSTWDSPGRPAGMRYRIAVLDDGAVRHGPGGLAIINFSGLQLAGTVNEEEIAVSAGLNPTLRVDASATIALTTRFKGRVYQSHVSTVSLGPHERALLILFPPFYPGALEVQSRLMVDQPPDPRPK